MLSNTMSTSAAISTVMQVPIQAPVMKKELANKMYSPSAYFLGRFISNCLFQIIHPTIATLVMFFHLGIEDSWDNFFIFLSISYLSNFVFAGLGYFIGICVTNHYTALACYAFSLVFFLCTNGTLTNLNAPPNWFVEFLTGISPCRFSCESFFIIITKHIPTKYYPNG